MPSIKRTLIWLSFRFRKWSLILFAITCGLVTLFNMRQDLILDKIRLYVPAKSQTKSDFLSIHDGGKLIEGYPKKETFKLKYQVFHDVKEKRIQELKAKENDHKSKFGNGSKPGAVENGIKPRAKENVGKSRPKLLSYDRQFSYPLNIDLPREVNKMLNGSTSGIVPINPHPYTYLHNNQDVCSGSENNEIFLLILVKSAVQYFNRRVTIRDTWNNHTYYKNVKFRTVFLLGYNESLTEEVKQEADKYNDIVQEDFIDIYLNNTLKVIMGFNWAVKFCKKARYLFFVDDDYYVNIHNLATHLLGLKFDKEQKLMTGYMLPRSVPYRDNMTKWYITLEDYPFDRWPPYLAGGAFVTSMLLARKLQLSFPFVKYIGIDDSYLGIVAKKLGIQLTHNHSFCYRMCKTRLKTIFSSHGFSKIEDMKGAWINQSQNKTVYVFKDDRKVNVKQKKKS